VFAGFQLVTTLLLLAAASSSFQPGLLKALAQHTTPDGQTTRILPGRGTNLTVQDHYPRPPPLGSRCLAARTSSKLSPKEIKSAGCRQRR